MVITGMGFTGTMQVLAKSRFHYRSQKQVITRLVFGKQRFYYRSIANYRKVFGKPRLHYRSIKQTIARLVLVSIEFFKQNTHAND